MKWEQCTAETFANEDWEFSHYRYKEDSVKLETQYWDVKGSYLQKKGGTGILPFNDIEVLVDLNAEAEKTPTAHTEERSMEGQGKEVTAITAMLDWLDTDNQLDQYAVDKVKAKATELLSKERGQIIDAYKSGGKSFSDIDYTSMVMDREATDYFTNTY